MQLIRKRAYARAGLAGNPSDGYFGKTIALSFGDFWAEVTLYEWDRLELILSQEDRSRFDSLDELVRDVELHGYYGGIRLVKATIKKFTEFCRRQGHPLHERNFSVRYQSNIPRQVGLAGSSAIIVATLRCLMEFYGVQIPLRIQPSLALAVETEELGIGAGLQDRVAQVYGGLVYMDFSRASMERVCGLDCGRYERLDPALLPPLYVAYNVALSALGRVDRRELRNPPIHLPPARGPGRDGPARSPGRRYCQVRRLGRGDHRHLARGGCLAPAGAPDGRDRLPRDSPQVGAARNPGPRRLTELSTARLCLEPEHPMPAPSRA